MMGTLQGQRKLTPHLNFAYRRVLASNSLGKTTGVGSYPAEFIQSISCSPVKGYWVLPSPSSRLIKKEKSACNVYSFAPSL